MIIIDEIILKFSMLTHASWFKLIIQNNARLLNEHLSWTHTKRGWIIYYFKFTRLIPHNKRSGYKTWDGCSKKSSARIYTKQTKSSFIKIKERSKILQFQSWKSASALIIFCVWKACITRIYFRAPFPLSFFSSVMFTVSFSKCMRLCFDISVWGLLNAPSVNKRRMKTIPILDLGLKFC